MFQNLGLLFLRFFIAVREINYPSCFIVYYEMKLRKKKTCRICYPFDYAANPALLGRIRKSFVILGVDIDIETRRDRRKFERREWDWMV